MTVTYGSKGVFRTTRKDTLVYTVERRYGIELHARNDMKLGNLLWERGFESLTQLLRAYRGQLTEHAAPRSIFLSFHREDLQQVNAFRLMMRNPRLNLQLSDDENRHPVNSEKSSYIKQVLRERIAAVDVVVCMIGDGTAWRDWVDWELDAANASGRGVCAVRLKGSRGRRPPRITRLNSPVASWNVPEIIAAIECAAARRT